MSNFSKAIEVGYEDKPIFSDDSTIVTSSSDTGRYRIACKFATTFEVTDKVTELYPNYITEAIKTAKIKLVNHVFGEFRKPLYEIKGAIMRGNSRQAMELLYRLEDQMFKI